MSLESEKVRQSLLEVKTADFRVLENAFNHHTDSYDRVMTEKDRCLVIRRGVAFKFQLTFDRPYDKGNDLVSLVFLSGKLNILLF